MTVLPGSLDYLYYQGILDHVPYEAYDMSYVPALNNQSTSMPSISELKRDALSDNSANLNSNKINISSYKKQNINSNSYSYNSASQYLDSAKQGMIYEAYNSGDTFVKNPYSNSSQNYSTVGGNNKNINEYEDAVNNLNTQKTNFWRKNGNNSDKSKKGTSKDPVLGSSPWKGLAALGLIILTPILIIKGFKRH